MNKYTEMLNTLAQGGAMGVIGYAIGVAFVEMSLREALKYAVIAIVSGTFSLHLAGVSPFENYKFHIAICAGLFGFFIIKIIIVSLDRFSKEPLKNLYQFIASWKGKK